MTLDLTLWPLRMKRSEPPSWQEIAEAQKELTAELIEAKAISDPTGSCWACGWSDETFKPIRAHIVADSDGGPNVSSNYLLLCSDCHAEQPDSMGWPTQLAWLRSHPSWTERHIKKMENMAGNLERAVAAVRAAAAEQGGNAMFSQWVAYVGGEQQLKDIILNRFQSASSIGFSQPHQSKRQLMQILSGPYITNSMIG